MDRAARANASGELRLVGDGQASISLAGFLPRAGNKAAISQAVASSASTGSMLTCL